MSLTPAMQHLSLENFGRCWNNQSQALVKLVGGIFYFSIYLFIYLLNFFYQTAYRWPKKRKKLDLSLQVSPQIFTRADVIRAPKGILELPLYVRPESTTVRSEKCASHPSTQPTK